jgi:hypothetical protein
VKPFLLVGLVIVGLTSAGVAEQNAATGLGQVRISRDVLADGTPLQAGLYEIRLTGAERPPAKGMSARAERWVEFVSKGTVAGRELATVIADTDMAIVAEGPRPRANASRVEILKGGDYLRVWINRRGEHYLLHMPVTGSR